MPLNKQSTLKSAKKLKALFFDLIFPIECINCGQEGIWLCEKCFRQLAFKSNQYCLHCKQKNTYGQFCKKCQPHYFLNGIWIAGDYENKIIADLIKNLKYKFIQDIAQILGNYMALFLRDLLNKHRLVNIDLKNGPTWRKFNTLTKSPNILLEFNQSLIMPVPLHKKRRQWRGFNQAEAIAKILSEHFNIQINLNNLVRVKHKKPQAKLGEADRHDNIKNCFAWQGNNLYGRHIILVDDVTTTGSTLNECAKILKNNGAGEIWGLVAAKG